MTRKAHILLVDDDPTENLILRALIRKVSNIEIELHYCQTMEGACRAAVTPVQAVPMRTRGTRRRVIQLMDDSSSMRIRRSFLPNAGREGFRFARLAEATKNGGRLARDPRRS